MCLQCYFEALVIEDADDKSLFERMKTIMNTKLPCSCRASYMALLFPAVIMFASDSVKSRVIKQHIIHRLCVISSDYPTKMFGLGTGSSGIFGRSKEVDITNLRLCVGELNLRGILHLCGASPSLCAIADIIRSVSGATPLEGNCVDAVEEGIRVVGETEDNTDEHPSDSEWWIRGQSRLLKIWKREVCYATTTDRQQWCLDVSGVLCSVCFQNSEGPYAVIVLRETVG